MNDLTALWESTESLYRRFGIFPPPINDAHRVFFEEVGEFALAAILGEDAHKEAADVIVTVMGLLISTGFTLAELQQGIQAVIAKNDAKTHETHSLNANGKIARK